ncbi:uncharacterized protein E0L32_005699 [Thyridium curvatum]|uniref:DUF1761-domain-containing protein n=1 Tax=Thyridium curvatum TaxID=1093900 RepID=A0A507B9C6_9PEZI|nr:uncharacterized protein E0L32_005699 [Thyridium curvatum]TPX13999.1 hypothetical protein E0L32_005699 [Thyridium curvatum]
MSLHYLPPVKPSAIALGTLFCHGTELAGKFHTHFTFDIPSHEKNHRQLTSYSQTVLAPIFGATYQRAKEANTKEEFLHSRQATGAAVAWGTSLVGSALQSYGVGALINATGTLSYKGAAYLGALIFAATSAPGYINELLVEKRPAETVGVSVVAKLLETVGLATFLTWWGTRTNPFD